MPDETPQPIPQPIIDAYLQVLQGASQTAQTMAQLNAALQFANGEPLVAVYGSLGHLAALQAAYTQAKANLEAAFPTITGTVSTPTA